MCYFLYLECDRCRWPEMNNIRGVILCDEFKNHAQDRGWRAAFAEPERSPQSLASWRCLGLYTFIRANDVDYDIYMSRDCVRWVPDHSAYVCRRCQASIPEVNPDSAMDPDELRMWTAAFDEAARSLRADADNETAPAIAPHNSVATSLSPADAEAELNVNWEALMGPGPLTNLGSSAKGSSDTTLL